MSDATFYLTGDPAADDLLASDPNALLLGMVLDQQVSMEKAFSGPAVIAERMGGHLDVAAIAAADPEVFAEICSRTPAVHRFPGAMAGRLQAVCRQLVEQYDADASHLWADASTGAELKKRLLALPGFGQQKASIFLALLGKQFGVTPPGWDTAAGAYGEAGAHRSVADITDPESLKLVRESKRAAKAAAKSAAEK
ncbi:Fe-S cluster assembly protein HesB [Nakamurella silvestris]|nr:Fe-S cluster assembly protein HesB [Nakamurella silvestris]